MEGKRENMGGEECENKEQLRIGEMPLEEKTEREPVGEKNSIRI